MATVDQNTQDVSMLATKWYGKRDVRVEEAKKPAITKDTDALLRITATAICGSDLHMYNAFMPGMQKGDIVGHEFMGIVEEVGPAVKNIKKGDRVVAAFDLGCGSCFYCKKDLYSSCDTTNPPENTTQSDLYGDRTAGLSGYSHITGGYAGGQAEYATVVNADVNLLKIKDNSVSDEKVLFLSDILPTAWHACELGEVSDGDIVAIWGAGPVGILAARLAQIRGAKRVIMIDNQTYRLKFAQEKVPGVEAVNFDVDKDVTLKLKEITDGRGPDVGIEAVGLHYTKTLSHKIQTSLGLETDSGDILNEIITSVRKGGRISVVGIYVATINGFMMGPLFEKGMSMKCGQTPCQKYWTTLTKLIEEGKIDPSFVISHRLPLEKAAHGYQIFDDKENNCIKVVLKPQQKA